MPGEGVHATCPAPGCARPGNGWWTRHAGPVQLPQQVPGGTTWSPAMHEVITAGASRDSSRLMVNCFAMEPRLTGYMNESWGAILFARDAGREDRTRMDNGKPARASTGQRVGNVSQRPYRGHSTGPRRQRLVSRQTQHDSGGSFEGFQSLDRQLFRHGPPNGIAEDESWGAIFFTPLPRAARVQQTPGGKPSSPARHTAITAGVWRVSRELSVRSFAMKQGMSRRELVYGVQSFAGGRGAGCVEDAASR